MMSRSSSLSRSAKHPSSMEPPDKKRRVELQQPADELWDDDLDQYFTQDNLSAIDNLVLASQHVGGEEMTSRTMGGNARSRIFDSGLGQNLDLSRAGFEPERQSIGISTTSMKSLRASSDSTVSKSLPVSSSSLVYERKTQGNGNSGVGLRDSSAAQVTCGVPSCVSSDFISGKQKSFVAVAVADGAGDAMQSGVTTGSETISPALPGSSAQVVQVDVARVLEECAYYKSEFNKLKDNQYVKDGQIKILRQKCDQAQTDLSHKNLEIVRLLNQKSEERNKREAELETENEKLKTQLQFRQQEVTEMKNQLKRLEKQPKSGERSLSELSRSPVASPRAPPKSPMVSESPSVAARRQGRGNFPTSQSFLAQNSTASLHSECVGENAKVQMRRQRMKLNLPQPSGVQSGGHFVNSLLQQQLAQMFLNSDELPQTGSSVSSSSSSFSTQTNEKPAGDSGTPSSKTTRSQSRKNLMMESALCLAHVSVDSLLSNGNYSAGDLLHAGIKSCALLLPLIEETLKKHVSILQKSPKKSPSTGSSGHSSARRLDPRSMTETVGLPFRVLPSGSGMVVESELVHTLRVLHHLVKHCDHVRAVAIGEVSDGTSGNVGDNQVEEVADAVVQLTISRLGRECHLVDYLIYLANPDHTKNRHQGAFVPVLALSILQNLIQSCTEEHLQKFLPLFKTDCLFHCLHTDCGDPAWFVLAYRVLALMTVAAQKEKIASRLCSFQENCFLLRVISFCCEGNSMSNWKPAEVTAFHRKVLSVLGSILRVHFHGNRWLTGSKCECSSKLVGGVLRIVCEEYRIYTKDRNSGSVLAMRNGIGVLHLLAVEDKSFVLKSIDVGGDCHLSLIEIRKLFRSCSEIPDQEGDFWFILSDTLSFSCSSDEGDTKLDEGDTKPHTS